MSSCSNCGFENPDEARFCSQCGSPMRPEGAGRAERRQITVVFSDLSGFTAMSENLDPEDVREVMAEIFSSATDIIERYSGRVDKLLGDAVMSVFGDPTSHEDDAERAVRATMEIHRVVDELSPAYEGRIGRPLRMHSGINTGLVVTSPGAVDAADTGPLGDTINLAARLEDLSGTGEILIGPETARLVSKIFELEDYGAQDLKGKSGPVQVMKVVGFKTVREEPSRKQARFIGRHEELGILMAAVERVQDGEGSVFGIRAEAGTGKTRLLEEFHARLADPVQWLEGRAYAYGVNIPFAPLVDLISNAIDVREDDTQDSIATKLETEIGPLVGHSDHLLDPFVRLYGLPERPDVALDKDSFRDRLLESLTSVVQGLCARAPTVLVLQDLHWADPSTVGIVDALIRALTSPVVIVANYRPTHEIALPGSREIRLEPLSPRQSKEMISSLLDGGEPPVDLVDFVVDRTDGNPFYVEEIINSLIETRTLALFAGEWQVVGSLADADLPTSVRGVIAARIDRLEPDRRRVLREASVVGRQFLYDVIRRVATTTETLEPSLADLETADLIRERNRQADLEYFFKHALTQDVAYEGLLKQERIELHARAAAAIEAQFTGRLDEVTETLAYHWTQGGVVDKAVQYSRAAGRKAMDRYALIEAQSHFETAYRMLNEAEPGPTNDEAMVDLILDWAILFYYQAHLLALDDLLERHSDAVDRLGDERRRMWWLIWRGHATGFRLDQGGNTRFLDEAVAIAVSLGDSTALAYAKTWLIWARFVTGDLDGAIAAADDIAEWVLDNRRHDPYPYFKSRCTLAFVLSAAGRPEGVAEMCREVVRFGREVGNNRCIAFGQQGIAFLENNLGSYRAAIEIAEAASAIAKDPIYRDTAQLTILAAANLAGDDIRAREAVMHLRTAVEDGVDLPAPLFVGIGDAVVKIGEGELSQGIELLERTIDTARDSSRIWEWMFGRLARAVVYSRIATGEIEGDLRSLLRNPRFVPHFRRARKDSIPILEGLIEEARDRGFIALTHLAGIELARVLIQHGDRARARELLEEALTIVVQSSGDEAIRLIRELLART